MGEGITRGFRVDLNYGVRVGTSAIKNVHSAETHPQPIDKYVQQELKAGRTIQLEEAEVASSPHEPLWSHTEASPEGEMEINNRFVVP